MTVDPNGTLNALLELFRQGIPETDFSAAYPGTPGSRVITRPAVTGEVSAETVKPGSEEVRYGFRIFLPEGVPAERAEEIFSAMCSLAGASYPGFSAISRGASKRDGSTGLLTVECTLSFLSQTGGGGSSPVRRVVLGGQEYRVTAIKTSVSRTGEELISVGETEPFALRGEKTEYTVELEGLDAAGLERLAVFTAELGEVPATVYQGCRWKSISDALRKAVFVSRSRVEPAGA